MVYKLLKNKSSLTVSDFVSLCCLHICNCISYFCNCISYFCNWISHPCNWIPHFCSETRRNAADTDESKLMEDQSHNNRVEVQEPITCEVEYSKFNGHHSRILNETFQVPSIFSFSLLIEWLGLKKKKKKLLVLKKRTHYWLQTLIPRYKFYVFKDVQKSLAEMSSETYVDGSQSFLKCSCSDRLKDNRIITQKKTILVAPQVLVVKIDRIHPMIGYKPTPIDYPINCFKLAEKQYSLTGVCIYTGNTNRHGHYYAFVKNMHNGMWLRCDDANVRIMQNQSPLNSDATVLIYQFGQWPPY
ncbi:ubiquitin-specific protease 25 [Reticulomyxa filosa]|uniref:Ubiquitin-specific protease 25 n=1 Tax=Reticulomyxa filosa TaxID=46433 RepID=X6N1N3_RETFI|nr:ubiquitin-specific protease 25 [Reticulomyxa filosa]|eukprot:ETO19227.1 ubiquitin-specific protease 25 [Reticulomyxa filosa]